MDHGTQVSFDESPSRDWDVGSNVESSNIADQVTQVAESVLLQTGFVYEETSGMYYDYNTGYYYDTVRTDISNFPCRLIKYHYFFYCFNFRGKVYITMETMEDITTTIRIVIPTNFTAKYKSMEMNLQSPYNRLERKKSRELPN